MISKENQTLVFEALVRITERKESRKKMASVFAIRDELRDAGIDAPMILVEGCIDVLIQHKLIRYYRNDKGYIYFGVTEFGWERWDKKCENDSKITA